MSPTLLLTGFVPFGGDSRNPSLELAQALDGATIGALRIVAQSLPCEFAAAPAALQRALDRWSPRLVLALGQAAGRAELSLERIAINLIDARIADNAGDRPIDEPVRADGPAAYFSSLPIKPMVQAIRAAGVAASVSHSAGTFVCNQIFYELQHRLARAEPAVPSGFMHLPLLPQQSCRRDGGGELPCMPLAAMVDGLRAALQAAVAGPGEGEAPVVASEGRLD